MDDYLHSSVFGDFMKADMSSTALQQLNEDNDFWANMTAPLHPPQSSTYLYDEQGTTSFQASQQTLAAGDEYGFDATNMLCNTDMVDQSSCSLIQAPSTYQSLEGATDWAQDNLLLSQQASNSNSNYNKTYDLNSKSLLAAPLFNNEFTNSLQTLDNPIATCSPPILSSSSNTGTGPSTSGGLSCPYPLCKLDKVFKRPCDVRKHYRLHFRKYACRVADCTLANGGPPMFTLRKDRNRHERAHRPSITCQHCDRLFSRLDNLRYHCQKVHHDLV